MSKGLEALVKLGNETVAIKDRNTVFMNGTNNSSYTHLTQVKNINKTCYEIIEKELKALEIIKKKNVDIEYIKTCFYDEKDGMKEYNSWVGHDEDRALTQEEYNLLKEVLG